MLPIDVIAAVLYFMLTRDADTPAPPDTRLMVAHLGLTILSAFLLTTVALRLLELWLTGSGGAPGRVREAVGWASMGVRVFCLVLFLFELNVIGWPGSLLVSWRRESELLQALLGLAPFVVQVTLSWLPLRRLEALVHPGRWTAGGYVRFRFQYTFFILIPWVCLWGVIDLARLAFPEGGMGWLGGGTAMWATLVGTVLVMAAYPAVLVRFWQCRRLPDGPLRDDLRILQEKAGVRFNEIYVWSMGSAHLLNGAALGYVSPFRYMLLSEGLLERLTREEVLAVAAHELGHLRHRHLLWYLLVTMAFVGLLDGISDRIGSPHLSVLAFCALLGLYLRVVFGFISRRFERQADVVSLELMGSAEPLMSGLEKIAWFSGNIRSAKCWHHRSVEARVAFVREAAREPALRLAHHGEVATLKRMILGGCFVLVCLSVWERTALTGSGGPPSLVAPQPVTERARWLAVLDVMPDDPDAPAELARAALDGGDFANAEAWLRRAEERADTEARKFRCRLLASRLATLRGVFPE